tara:strand:- start:576 stop:1142 length:567 start_codon:yes stop_codon:yes gene_type:complete
MTRPRSVADIKSKLLRPATTNHFSVNINLPGGLSIDGSIQDDLNLMCSDAVLPGHRLATFEATNDRYGVTERHAYRKVHDDELSLTFYVDEEKYLPITVFEGWMAFITNEGSDMAEVNYSYKVKYPDQYRTQMEIYKFEKDYDTRVTYIFYDCYPTSIASTPVSYSDQNNLLKYTVGFSYIKYKTFVQ